MASNSSHSGLCTWPLAAVFSGLMGAAAVAQEGDVFKPGTYTGTLQFISAVDEKLYNKTTVKVRARTTSPSRLLIMAPPAFAVPGVGQSDDDHPVKVYALEHDFLNGGTTFAEVRNVDAGLGSVSIQGPSKLVIKPKSVQAEITLPSRSLATSDPAGNFTVTQKYILKLTHIGP